MITKTVLFLFIAGFIACFVKGISGFGSSIIFVPIAGFILPMNEVIPIAVTIAFLINIAMTVKLTNFKLAWENKALLIGLPLGGFVGAFSFGFLSGGYLKLFIGAILLIVSIQEVLRMLQLSPAPSGRQSPQPLLDSIMAFVSGIAGGLFSIAGPVVVSYLRINTKRFHLRKLVVPAFALSALATLLTYYGTGNLPNQPLYYAASVLGSISGMVIGISLLHYVNERMFSALVAIFVLLSSANLILF